MQANTTLKRFDLGQFKAAALAIGIVASIALGTITSVALRHDNAQRAATAAITAPPKTSANVRFMEANQLPSAAAAVQLSNYRFMEQNVWSTPASHVAANARMLEINALPGDAGAVARRAGNQHLLEINLLPDDSALRLPPSGERGTCF